MLRGRKGRSPIFIAFALVAYGRLFGPIKHKFGLQADVTGLVLMVCYTPWSVQSCFCEALTILEAACLARGRIVWCGWTGVLGCCKPR